MIRHIQWVGVIHVGFGLMMAHAASIKIPSLQLSSKDFTAGEAIPKKFTCDGLDVSPRLSWTNVPSQTKSFALIMDDPDASVGTWVHWVLYNIPGDSRGLEENILKTETLANGAVHGASWGVDSFQRVGYGGPCPPPGKPHHYSFRLYALDKTLNLPAKVSVAELVQAVQGHIVGQAELVGLYQR